jgi:hypothetical protein
MKKYQLETIKINSLGQARSVAVRLRRRAVQAGQVFAGAFQFYKGPQTAKPHAAAIRGWMAWRVLVQSDYTLSY